MPRSPENLYTGDPARRRRVLAGRVVVGALGCSGGKLAVAAGTPLTAVPETGSARSARPRPVRTRTDGFHSRRIFLSLFKPDLGVEQVDSAIIVVDDVGHCACGERPRPPGPPDVRDGRGSPGPDPVASACAGRAGGLAPDRRRPSGRLLTSSISSSRPCRPQMPHLRLEHSWASAQLPTLSVLLSWRVGLQPRPGESRAAERVFCRARSRPRSEPACTCTEALPTARVPRVVR